MSGSGIAPSASVGALNGRRKFEADAHDWNNYLLN